MPRWKLRPGPATSANAPRACALKALNVNCFQLERVPQNCILWNGRKVYIRERKMNQLGQDMRQNSRSPDTKLTNRAILAWGKSWKRIYKPELIQGESRYFYLRICFRPSSAVSEVWSSSKECKSVGTISSIACIPALYIIICKC